MNAYGGFHVIGCFQDHSLIAKNVPQSEYGSTEAIQKLISGHDYYQLMPIKSFI
jgi:hypothetical protein